MAENLIIDKRTQMMANENIPLVIIKLALPAIISLIVMAIYNMADTYFVSLVGTGNLEVAAVSVFMPIMLTIQSVAVLFASGGAAYLSRLLGNKKNYMADLTASTTVFLSFIAGIFVAVFGLIYCKQTLLLFGASEQTLSIAESYANILFIAAPIQLTNMAFNNLLRAEGKAVQSMIGMITGAVLNIILDPILISILAMGVSGAAIATGIAQCVTFILLGWNYWKKKTVAKLIYKNFKFNSQIVLMIFKVGISTFLIQIFTAISFGIMNICTKIYGDGAIAAIGIANRLQFIGFAVIFGFSQGYQPVLGYNFGAKQYGRVKQSMIFGTIVAICLGTLMTVMFRIFTINLITFFTSDNDVIDLGVQSLQWFTTAFPVTAFSLIVLMTYQSMGKAVGATLLAICRQGVCLIPTILVLANLLGFFGILIAPFVADLISGTLAGVLEMRVFKTLKLENA